MSTHAYSEDPLVEQAAIGLFADLGWQTVSAMEETFGATGTLGRETKGEVVLATRLRNALVVDDNYLGAAEPGFACRGHSQRDRRNHPRPLGHTARSCQPRGVAAAQSGHYRARPGT